MIIGVGVDFQFCLKIRLFLTDLVNYVLRSSLKVVLCTAQRSALRQIVQEFVIGTILFSSTYFPLLNLQ